MAGQGHSCARSTADELICWGDGMDLKISDTEGVLPFTSTWSSASPRPS